ncbi:MAG: hypothetical protein AAGM67_20805, partial [Bacteroidota bacterium]
MKQFLPSKSSGPDSPPNLRPLLVKKGLGRVQPTTANKLLKGAVYGLLLCGMAWYIGTKTNLFSANQAHQINGSLYLDANGDQQQNPTEKQLPFVRLHLHADLNRNQQLDAADLAIASTMTDAEGAYQFDIP